MKYKAGDKVKIKSLVWYNKNRNEYSSVVQNGISFTYSMSEYCGKISTITSIGSDNEHYIIDVDGGDWYWCDWMLEDEPTVSDHIKEKRFQAACSAMQGLCVGKITADIKKGQCSDIAEIAYLLADKLLKQGGFTE